MKKPDRFLVIKICVNSKGEWDLDVPLFDYDGSFGTGTISLGNSFQGAVEYLSHMDPQILERVEIDARLRFEQKNAAENSVEEKIT